MWKPCLHAGGQRAPHGKGRATSVVSEGLVHRRAGALMGGVHGAVQACGRAGWHLCGPAERGWAVGPGVGRVLHPEIQSH